MALSDYIQLEYIESTGTQYININFTTTNNMRLVGEFSLTKSQTDNYLFGTNITNDLGAYFIFGQSNRNTGKILTYCHWNNGITIPYDTNKHTFDIKGSNVGGQLKIDNTIGSAGALSTFKNLYLFACNSNNAVSGKISARLYSFQLYNDNVLLRDMMPVKRRTDNVVGLYDKVNDIFYTNQGTGEFIAGPIIYTGSPLKINLLEIQQSLNTELDNLHNIFGDYLNSYTRLEYIQSTGTQYIDTLYKHQLNKTRIVADIDIQQNQVGNWCNPFGSWGNVQSSRVLYGIEFPTTNANADAYCYYGRDGTNWNYKNISGRKIFDWNKNVYKIGSNTYTFTLSSLASAYNFYIFNCCSYTNKPNTNGGCLKLYSFKIYDNDVLVRDYIPVRRNSDGAVCLYDNVSNQYFLNAGTGTFVAGGEL